MSGSTRFAWVAIPGLLACALGAARCTLPEVHGRVVDRDGSGAIAGAIVFERFETAGAMGEPARTVHVRFTESDEGGAFAFPSATATPRVIAQTRYPPRYGFAHADYGLVRSVEAPADGAALVLTGERGAIAAHQALATLCESPPREDWEHELRERLCAPAPPRRTPTNR